MAGPLTNCVCLKLLNISARFCSELWLIWNTAESEVYVSETKFFLKGNGKDNFIKPEHVASANSIIHDVHVFFKQTDDNKWIYWMWGLQTCSLRTPLLIFLWHHMQSNTQHSLADCNQNVIQMKTEMQDSDAFQMAAINNYDHVVCWTIRCHKMQHTKQMFAKMPTSKKWWACVIVSALGESHLGGSGGIIARDILKR